MRKQLLSLSRSLSPAIVSGGGGGGRGPVAAAALCKIDEDTAAAAAVNKRAANSLSLSLSLPRTPRGGRRRRGRMLQPVPRLVAPPFVVVSLLHDDANAGRTRREGGKEGGVGLPSSVEWRTECGLQTSKTVTRSPLARAPALFKVS